MNSLKEKLLKNSTLDFTSSLDISKIFDKKDMIPTIVPMINVGLSGYVTGGLVSGLTMIAGESKHFKSGFSLLLAQAFLQKYKDGIILFYDSEFGTPQSYFSTFDIPLDRVVHSPITNIEEFKFDIMSQLKEIKRDDPIMIIVDSIGNLASLKEVQDAENEKSVGDLTRAKQMKGLFRMIGPKLTLQNIPMVVVNHIYMDMGLYPKAIVSGGTGSYYNSDNIWIISRQQDKDEKQLYGYHFIINVEKSRYVKEKSKIPITVSFEGGINRWSGLFEVALEGGFIVKPKNGWYAEVDQETGEILEPSKREDDMRENSEYWKRMLKNDKFIQYIENKYKMSTGSSILTNEPEHIS